MFRTWSNALPADVEVCPVQLPGRSERLMERPFTDLSSLIEVLAQALAPLLDKPFAFFGHSLGALIGFELARQLRRQYGVNPVRLFVSAGRPPQVPRRGAPIHNLPRKEFLAALRRLDGTLAEVFEHEELLEIILPLLRADFAVYETYVYSKEAPLNARSRPLAVWRIGRLARATLKPGATRLLPPSRCRCFPVITFF